MKTVSSRRANRDYTQAHLSPSGSPTNEPELHLPFGSRLEVVSFGVAQDVSRLSSRKGDSGYSQSYSPTSPLSDDGQFKFPDSERSPVDNFRARSSNSNFANYDDPGSTVEPRRLNIETAMSGTASLVNDEPTDSPESGASWFSDSSSVDGKETDSNDQDSPSYRERFQQLSAAAYEGADFPQDDDGVAEIDSATRVSSSHVIQRSWRQWKMRQHPVAVAKEENRADLDLDGLQSRLHSEHDHTMFSSGVLVQKVGGGNGGSNQE